MKKEVIKGIERGVVGFFVGEGISRIAEKISAKTDNPKAKIIIWSVASTLSYYVGLEIHDNWK